MIRSPAGFDGGDRIKRYLDYYQPSYGVMMLSAGQFSPASLFAAGEQGAWYDPSDFSTMFQDNLGATPVTAVEQTVGLILDKSGRGNNASQATAGSRPTLSARVNILLGTATLATQNVTTGAATYTLAFSGAGIVTATGTNIGVYSAGSNSLVCTAGTLTLTVSGSVTSADLRVTNDGVGLPAYQRVTTATDYDTANFPLYLRFDGSNDSLATAAIDFSATNKATVWTGVRKLSDTAFQLLCELTAGSFAPGSFSLDVGTAAGDASRRTYGIEQYTSAGSPPTTTAGAFLFPSPDTRVMTGQWDKAQATQIAQMIMRLNGVGQTLTFNNANLGSGNFANDVLYIGRRGGTASPLNARLYSLIVRGAQSTATQITNTETWVNGKTRAY